MFELLCIVGVLVGLALAGMLLLWMDGNGVWKAFAESFADPSGNQVRLQQALPLRFQDLGVSSLGLNKHYVNCVNFVVTVPGLRIAPMWFWSFGHPPLLLPWKAIRFSRLKPTRIRNYAAKIGILSQPDLELLIPESVVARICEVRGLAREDFYSVPAADGPTLR